jgi:hypothetical protein
MKNFFIHFFNKLFVITYHYFSTYSVKPLNLPRKTEITRYAFIKNGNIAKNLFKTESLKDISHEKIKCIRYRNQ